MTNPNNNRKALTNSIAFTVLGACATACAWSFFSTGTLILVVGVLSSLVLGAVIYFGMLLHRGSDPSSFDTLQLLLELAKDQDISSFHNRATRFLVEASKRNDTIFKELLIQRLKVLGDEIKALGDGRIEFSSTESWRIFYEQILRSPGTHSYRSVSHIETQSYWQDGAGRKSTELNLELHDSGKVSVERIAIVADHLWRPDELFPVSGIHEWLEEQYRYGIWISLIRESELEKEQELISDFGIYGNRAIGRQIVDSGGRTSRFILSFDYQDVEKADSIWQKLNVFATSYSDLLDQQH